MSGLLIVNADDWGASHLTTERIADCARVGGVTSATAMVYMADSERAAERAHELGLPTGLHLNLTQRFDGPAVPPAVRAAHERVIRRFGLLRRRDRLLLDPRIRADVRRCVDDQLECFRTLYGREPTHLDGHNHVHLNPVVLSVIPRRLAIRTAVRDPRIRSGRDVPRMLRHRLIRAWHGSTDFLFPITQLAPALGGAGLDAHLALAREHSVELITHPGYEPEHELLSSPAWVALLGAFRLGSFLDVRGRARDAR